MNKLQTWNAAKEIIESLNLDIELNKTAMLKFEGLLAPKKSGGGSRPEPLLVDGVNYYYCRFTNLYFPSSQMIYQNDETRAALKDKGYSNIGISLWNKGQKFLKDMKMKSVEIAYGDDQSDEARAEGMKLHQEATQLTKDNSMNDYNYLMTNFLTNEQADILEGLDLPTK